MGTGPKSSPYSVNLNCGGLQPELCPADRHQDVELGHYHHHHPDLHCARAAKLCVKQNTNSPIHRILTHKWCILPDFKFH